MGEGPERKLQTHRAFVSTQKYPVHALRTLSEVGEEAVKRIRVHWHHTRLGIVPVLTSRLRSLPAQASWQSTQEGPTSVLRPDYLRLSLLHTHLPDQETRPQRTKQFPSDLTAFLKKIHRHTKISNTQPKIHKFWL